MIVAPSAGVFLIDRDTLGCLYLAAAPGLRQLASDGLSAPAAVRTAVEEAGRLLEASTPLADPGHPAPSENGHSVTVPLMTAGEAAHRTGVNVRTLTRWAAKGRLPSARQARPGSPWLVALDEVERARG